jgi:glycosyltransferase involved in cell wall biosynthesis
MNAQYLTGNTAPRAFPDGVTIAIPNWNHEYCLPRSLTSALNAVKALGEQGVAAEVLVIDDGSRDGSVPLLRQLETLHYEHGLRVWLLAHNTGLGPTRNVALQQAKYRYIAFLDADNELLPENFHLFYRAIRDTQAALVYGNVLWLDAAQQPKRVVNNESVRARLFEENYIDACLLADRVQLLDVGGYYQMDKLLHGLEDWELNLHLLSQGRKLVFVPLAFAIYYELPQSLLEEFNQDSGQAFRRVHRMYDQLGVRAQMPHNGQWLRYHPDLGYL